MKIFAQNVFFHMPSIGITGLIVFKFREKTYEVCTFWLFIVKAK